MPADRVPPGLDEPDSCAVSDALDRLDLPGAVTGLLPLTVARRIAGRVITVELGASPGGERGGGVGERGGGNPGDRDRDGDGSGRPPRRHLGAAAIDAAGPGDVIVVAAQGRADAAGWGGVLSAAAAARGSAA